MPIRTSYGFRRLYADLDDAYAASSVGLQRDPAWDRAYGHHAPYHAGAADRIASTEARLGRKIQSSRELPDDMARALWHKRRVWYFARQMDFLDTDSHSFFVCIDERDEAKAEHRRLITDMWATRRASRRQTLTILAAIASDRNVSSAFRGVLAGEVENV